MQSKGWSDGEAGDSAVTSCAQGTLTDQEITDVSTYVIKDITHGK